MKETKDRYLPKISSKPVTLRLVWGYYIATPLFLIVELVWGISFRVPLSLPTRLRYTYYVCCFVCGAICYFRPRITPVIAVVESTVNITLIFLGFVIAITKTWHLDETMTVPEALTLKGVLSFAVIATVWIISFQHSLGLVQKMVEEKSKS
jgi:hypothetical protein